MITWSFCEAVTAISLGKWHIRRLTDRGQKLGGGIDTSSLCGWVKPPYGWDLSVPVERVFDLEDGVCQECLAAWRTVIAT